MFELVHHHRLNESPSQKEGKWNTSFVPAFNEGASMKALPKRKGNLRWLVRACSANLTLNESPSEKEGKSRLRGFDRLVPPASMKAPPKRKGN